MGLRDDLIAAKALIDTPEKWGKRAYLDQSTGRMCVFGALMVVNGVDIDDPRSFCRTSDAEIALARALSGDGIGSLAAVAAFNDHPSTTHDDIMALFDRAIEAAGDA